MPLSRRRVLLASGASLMVGAIGSLALAEAGVLPGSGKIDRFLGRCDVPAPSAARGEPGPIVAAEFASAKRRRQVGYAIAYPPGHGIGDALPVCLTLHGYGGTG